MSDADDRLKALFAADAPPARDPVFTLDVVRRMQRRRLWLELIGRVPWVIAASAILWVTTPWLQAASRPAAALLGMIAPAAGVAVGALLLASPRVRAF
jgi:hypothetical protein